MSNEYNPLSSISWQLKRIADALEEMNRPKNDTINVIDQLRKRNTKPRVWSKSEEKQLSDLLDEDTPIKEIAKLLDRSEGAIRSRISNHMHSPQTESQLIRQMLKSNKDFGM